MVCKDFFVRSENWKRNKNKETVWVKQQNPGKGENKLHNGNESRPFWIPPKSCLAGPLWIKSQLFRRLKESLSSWSWSRSIRYYLLFHFESLSRSNQILYQSGYCIISHFFSCAFFLLTELWEPSLQGKYSSLNQGKSLWDYWMMDISLRLTDAQWLQNGAVSNSTRREVWDIAIRNDPKQPHISCQAEFILWNAVQQQEGLETNWFSFVKSICKPTDLQSTPKTHESR